MVWGGLGHHLRAGLEKLGGTTTILHQKSDETPTYLAIQAHSSLHEGSSCLQP